MSTSMNHDAIDWLRSQQKNLYTLFIVNLIGFSAVLRADYVYRDDIRRVLYNFEEWEQSGRLFSYLLSKAVFFGLNADATPFIQIAALFVLSCGGLLLIHALDKNANITHFICLSPLCLSPYMLENLSYKFDALWMALSVLFAIFPFFIYETDNRKSLRFSLTVLSIFCVFNLYQASFGFFIAIFLYLKLRDLRKDQPLSFFFKKRSILLLAAIVATILYAIEVKYFFPVTSDWGKFHSQTSLGNTSHLSILWHNIQRYYESFAKDWDGSLFQYVFLINTYAILIISLKSIFRHRTVAVRIVKTVLLIILLPALSLAPFLIQIFLTYPIFLPRTFLAVGCVFFILLFDPLLLFKDRRPYRYLFIGIALYCALQITIFGNIYGNMLASQKEWENNRLPLLTYHLAKARQMTGCNTIYFANEIGYSPTFHNIGHKYPIIYKLISPSIGRLYFPAEVLLRHGVELYKYPKEPMRDPQPLLFDEPWYDITATDNTCILKFKW